MPHPWAALCAMAEPGAAPSAEPPAGTIHMFFSHKTSARSIALEDAVIEEATGEEGFGGGRRLPSLVLHSV